MKKTLLNLLKNLIISLIISTIILLLIIIILNNLDNIIKLFTKNEMIIKYMKRATQRNREYPISIIASITIFNYLILTIIKKHNLVFIIFLILLTIVELIICILLTKLKDEFFYQFIQSTIQRLNNYIN